MLLDWAGQLQTTLKCRSQPVQVLAEGVCCWVHLDSLVAMLQRLLHYERSVNSLLENDMATAGMLSFVIVMAKS